MIWFGAILGVSGFFILIWKAPWVALGVFLILWGHNVDRAGRARKSIKSLDDVLDKLLEEPQ